MSANLRDSGSRALATQGSTRVIAFWHMLFECLRAASASLATAPLRSFLTMLGIAIGVASVIAVVSMVQGLASAIGQQFQSLGSDVYSVRADTSLEDALRGKRNHLHLSDLAALRANISGVQHLTPTVIIGGAFGGEVHYGAKKTSAILMGTTSDYQDVHRNYTHTGRFLNENDDQARRRVVVLGAKVRENLGLPADPSGAFVQLNEEWFKVVGVMEPRGEIFGISQDDYVLTPYETSLVLNGSTEEPDLSVSFAIPDLDEAEAIKGRVVALMRQLHGIRKQDSDDFTVTSSAAIQQSFRDVTKSVTLVLAAVVGISLMVGGIGVMNIMLVSVTERTREIGILKAIGAPREYILIQFLFEALILSVAGGLLGLVTGYAIAVGASALLPMMPSPSTPWWAALGSAGFSACVGIVFGIVPASNAANLSPIDALRQE